MTPSELDVTSWIDVLSGQLLRAHVVRRSQRESGLRQSKVPCVAGPEFGSAEVSQQRLAVLEQHVVRFDVAMDDAVAVRVVEAGGDLGGDAKDIGERKLRLPLQPGAERFPFDVWHDVEDRVVDRAGVKQRQDVGMLQLRGGLDFPQEPLDTDQLRELAVHHFDRDLAVVAGVVGEIDVCHPASANLSLDGAAVRQDCLEAIRHFDANHAALVRQVAFHGLGFRPRAFSARFLAVCQGFPELAATWAPRSLQREPECTTCAFRVQRPAHAAPRRTAPSIDERGAIL